MLNESLEKPEKYGFCNGMLGDSTCFAHMRVRCEKRLLVKYNKILRMI